MSTSPRHVVAPVLALAAVLAAVLLLEERLRRPTQVSKPALSIQGLQARQGLRRRVREGLEPCRSSTCMQLQALG